MTDYQRTWREERRYLDQKPVWRPSGATMLIVAAYGYVMYHVVRAFVL